MAEEVTNSFAARVANVVKQDPLYHLMNELSDRKSKAKAAVQDAQTQYGLIQVMQAYVQLFRDTDRHHCVAIIDGNTETVQKLAAKEGIRVDPRRNNACVVYRTFSPPDE